MVTGTTDAGTWSYIYSIGTREVTSNGSVAVERTRCGSRQIKTHSVHC